jgi:hypothetical protein
MLVALFVKPMGDSFQVAIALLDGLKRGLGNCVDKMNIEPQEKIVPEVGIDLLLDTFHLRQTPRQVTGDQIEITGQVHMRKKAGHDPGQTLLSTGFGFV